MLGGDVEVGGGVIRVRGVRGGNVLDVGGCHIKRCLFRLS